MKDWSGQTLGLCIDGVNTSVDPDLVGERQVSWLINGSIRGGKARTRPALVQRLVLPTGKVQGAGYFSVNRGKIILSIGGIPYRVNVLGNKFTYDSISLPWQNSSILNTAWMQETVGNLVIQDGQAAPIIYDGASARRSDIFGNEVPIGRMMAYGNGRLWVAVSRYALKAGDIHDGPGTELMFTETGYFLGGGAFYFPQRMTGLRFLPVNNTSTGYGSLIVFGRNRADSLRAEIASRDLWPDIPGFITQVLDDVGTASHHCITPVNQDLYWRDAEGNIRSLRSAAHEAQSAGNSGISGEIRRIVDFETAEWLDQCSSIFFENRVIFTASPFMLPGGQVAFRKLISMDCAPLATMRGKAAPAYDGEWNGINFVRLVTGTFDGRKRAFVVAQDGAGTNSLWEMMAAEREDAYLNSGSRVQRPITASVEFRRIDFGTPAKPKQLTRCDVYPSKIEGDVNIKVYWRTANRTQWNLWGEFDACATMTDPAEATSGTTHAFVNIAAQERGRVKSLTIPHAEDDIMQQALSVGHAFEIRLVWTGNVSIDRVDVWSRPLQDDVYSNIIDLPEACAQATFSDNEISYTIVPAS